MKPWQIVKILSFQFWLAALEGLAAIVFLVLLPGDGPFLGGLSFQRIVLLIFMALFCAGFVLLALKSSQLENIWNTSLRKTLLILATVGIITGLLVFLILSSLYHTSGEYRFFAYQQRLAPLLTWFILVCAQVIVGCFLDGFQLSYKNISHQKPLFWAALIFWALFLLTWVFSSLTGIGLLPDSAGWGTPTTPLMEWQIWLGWILGIVVLTLPQNNNSKTDLYLAILIWVAAAAIWLSQPVPEGYFAFGSNMLPNHEVYPFSDGEFYGKFSEGLLVGGGYLGQIPPRPLYILLLSLMTAIGGQEYTHIITLQTLLLAFLPVVLFFLGKKLHSRAAGVTAACFIILRELTSIVATPFSNNISNSKLFFSELPAALGICLFLLIVISWLQKPLQKKIYPLLAGGVFGLILLIRTQTFFILPFVFLISLIIFARHKKWKEWLASTALICAAIAVVIFPWLLRNYAITGQFVFDHPDSQLRVMAMRYSETADVNPERLSGENDAQYSARLSIIITDTMLKEPGRVAKFVSGQFINSEISNLLIFPLRNNLSDIKELFLPNYAFWQDWNGKISFLQGLLLALNLAILALGVGACWNRWHWIGLIPLFTNLSYNFSNALARNSGGRFLLPVDWIIIFYFAVGLIQAAILIKHLLGEKLTKTGASEIQSQEIKHLRLKSAGILGLFLLLGSSLPLAEKLIPQRYPDLNKAELIDKFISQESIQSSGLDLDRLKSFIEQEDIAILWGRVVYPRYYAQDEGEFWMDKTGYSTLRYPRLIFSVLNQSNSFVIFPLDHAPDYFPNAADSFVIACPAGNYWQANLTLITGENEHLYLTNSGDPYHCEIK